MNRLLNLVAVFVLLGTILLSPVRATTITSLQFESTPTGNSFDNEPAFPYMTSVNGGGLVEMMCDSFNEHIFYGEQWLAYRYELASDNVHNFQHFQTTPNIAPDINTAYDMLGYIMTGISSGKISPGDGNGAVWYMFEGAPAAGNLGDAASILSTALTAVSGDAGVWSYSRISIYTPLPLLQGSSNVQVDGAGTQYVSTTGLLGVPQEFVNAAPEPGSLLLLGTGMLLFGGLWRRKRQTNRA